MNIKELNNANIFTYDVGSFFDKPQDSIFLLYAPLAEIIFLADKQNLIDLNSNITKYLNNEEITPELHEVFKQVVNTSNNSKERVKKPSEYSKLSIIPTSNCNLKCSYCYSAEGRSTTSVSEKGIDATLKFFFENNKENNKELSIFITGGGEPLLAWDKLQHIFELSEELAISDNKELTLMLMTNGTILTDKIISSLKKYQVQVGVSFDIIEDIQMKQRGKYKLVKDNLLRLISNDIIPSISTVITKNNVNRQVEMVNEIRSTFKSIKHLNFDPAMDDADFVSPAELDLFFDQFIEHFKKARELCHEFGMTLDCNIIRKVQNINERYCPGKLCLTPSDSLSICHSISSPMEEHYEKAIYGSVNNTGEITINSKHFSELITTNANTYEECKDCIAKYHCGGGCLMYRFNYNQAKFDAVCRFTRKLVVEILLARLNDQYSEEMDTTIYEHIDSIFA